MLWTGKAAILEDFEHGNLGLYSQSGGVDNAALTSAAAHDGLLGVTFAGASGPTWYFRTDIPTQAGNEYRGFVRFRVNGVIRMGVRASSGGAYSATLGRGSFLLTLEDNTGYGFRQLAATAFSPQLGMWYQLALDWTNSGDMTAKVYDESGLTLLAATSTVATGATGSGGFAFYGDTNNAGEGVDFDSFSVVPEPLTSLTVALGVAAIVLRRARRVGW